MRRKGTLLDRMLKEALKRVEDMTPKQREEMYARQRESFVRAMTTPCEHGVLDYEQCPDCRDAAQKRILNKQSQHKRVRQAARQDRGGEE